MTPDPIYRSEVYCDTELRDAGVQHVLRIQPRRGNGAVDLVVGEDGRDVQQVIEIDLQFRSRATESQQLRETQIELIDTIAIERPRLDQVDSDVGHAARWRTAERLRHDGRGNVVVRRQLHARVAAERRADLHVHFGNEVRAEASELREESGREVTVLQRHRARLIDAQRARTWNRNADGDRLRWHEALGDLLGDRAEVHHGLPGAGAQLQRQAIQRACAHREIDTVPVMSVLAVIARRLHLIIDDPEELRRDGVEAGP